MGPEKRNWEKRTIYGKKERVPDRGMAFSKGLEEGHPKLGDLRKRQDSLRGFGGGGGGGLA